MLSFHQLFHSSRSFFSPSSTQTQTPAALVEENNLQRKKSYATKCKVLSLSPTTLTNEKNLFFRSEQQEVKETIRRKKKLHTVENEEDEEVMERKRKAR